MLHKILFLACLIGCMLSTNELSAQSSRQVAGKWVSVSRKASPERCQIDRTFEFKLDGEAIVTYGERFAECETSSVSYPSWTAEKKTFVDDAAQRNTENTIQLIGEEGIYMIIVDVFVDDYMKVKIQVKVGDQTRSRTLILKKVE
ncbi:hypothetical protein [Lewinella sp. LCG006]|uniref:hypothetical protein n=1 Tax=Lewinella sp. LCG006 TaxID=3231911 RepID=UPI00345FB88D